MGRSDFTNYHNKLVKLKKLSHWSDCPVNNGPALPPGECNCGGFHLPTWEKTMELAAHLSENLETDRFGKLEKHQIAEKLRGLIVSSRRK